MLINDQMERQLTFIIILLATLIIFGYTIVRFVVYFRITRPYPIRNIGDRIVLLLKVALFQSKIFRHPVIGLLHALVFWGFCIISAGTIEMVIDGIFGTDKILSDLGFFYQLLTASGDIFALLVLISIFVFIFRRLFMRVRRFTGIEMKETSHLDAITALFLIFLLMISLLGMNTFDILYNKENVSGIFPVSKWIAPFFHDLTGEQSHIYFEFNWWFHVVLIFIFANYLPYSKHFHVFMSVPNVFLSRMEPLGKLQNMDCVAREVRMMFDSKNTEEAACEPSEMSRFGVLDVTDVTWKNYLDSLTCTECGRCTAVCPANITGKKLSPRKIMMDLRARMKEKGNGIMKNSRDFDDGRSLLGDYITEEELWACTTCNACAKECPVNINHPSLIVDMRRYLVMEKASAPSGLNSIFANIENNG